MDSSSSFWRRRSMEMLDERAESGGMGDGGASVNIELGRWAGMGGKGRLLGSGVATAEASGDIG